MKLNELSDNPGATQRKKRIGRGPGSGMGKTGAKPGYLSVECLVDENACQAGTVAAPRLEEGFKSLEVHHWLSPSGTPTLTV